MREDFGSTWRPFRAAVRTGAVLGPVTSAAVVATAFLKDRPQEWLDAVLGGVVMGLLMPLLVLPTVLFSIRIENGVISHRLCRRWRLGHGRLVDLTKVEIGFQAAVRLHFANGTLISLLAADPRETQALCLHLVECRPEFEDMVFARRAAKIAKVVQVFRVTRSVPQPLLKAEGRHRVMSSRTDLRVPTPAAQDRPGLSLAHAG